MRSANYSLSTTFQDFSSSKIDDFCIAIFINHNVLWLQVTMNDIFARQRLESQYQAAYVECGGIIVYYVNISNGIEEILSVNVLK